MVSLKGQGKKLEDRRRPLPSKTEQPTTIFSVAENRSMLTGPCSGDARLGMRPCESLDENTFCYLRFSKLLFLSLKISPMCSAVNAGPWCGFTDDTSENAFFLHKILFHSI